MNKGMWLCPSCMELFRNGYNVRQAEAGMPMKACESCGRKTLTVHVEVSGKKVN